MPAAVRLSLHHCDARHLLRIGDSDLYVIRAEHYVDTERGCSEHINEQEGYLLFSRGHRHEPAAQWMLRNGLHEQVFGRRRDLLDVVMAVAATDPLPARRLMEDLVGIRRVAKGQWITTGEPRVTISSDAGGAWRLRLDRMEMTAPTLDVAQQKATNMIRGYDRAARAKQRRARCLA